MGFQLERVPVREGSNRWVPVFTLKLLTTLPKTLTVSENTFAIDNINQVTPVDAESHRLPVYFSKGVKKLTTSIKTGAQLNESAFL